MSPEVKQLHALLFRKGEPIPGALLRASEALEYPRTTIAKWLSGEWIAGEEARKRITKFVKSKPFIGRYKTGPKQPVKNFTDEKRVSVK